HYLKSYQQANKKLQAKTEWQYWYALALLEGNTKNSEHIQQKSREKAEAILSKLANKQDFYGLLSAKYYQQTFSIEDNIDLNDWDISNSTQQQLSAAIELYLLGEHAIASRQWYYSSKGFKRKQWREASAIAHQLQWHERMFRAIASSGFNTRINEQYPIAFEQDYAIQSKNTGIDISWLLAMSRQESAFAPLATSGKGAMGVMQLMPATAKRMAKELKQEYRKEDLYNPSYNIHLGSHYLQKLLARYNNNYVLATAAYNAGPHRVDEWLAARPIGDDWAHWIAAIPYKETRKYVQNILAFSHVYQQYLPDYLLSDLKLTLFQPQLNDDT
ncbi:MAG: lytic transglycosylase domain-containing protein, partial [Sinobacterium sp.]|nr:lytic transglycosylase domain-containing protein [Sinobacterium sp.]